MSEWIKLIEMILCEVIMVFKLSYFYLCKLVFFLGVFYIKRIVGVVGYFEEKFLEVLRF